MMRSYNCYFSLIREQSLEKLVKYIKIIDNQQVFLLIH